MNNDSETSNSIKHMLIRVNTNTTGIFSRIPEPIAMLKSEISESIGDNCVHISEFIIAKIKGRIEKLKGHPEITDDIFERLPQSLFTPLKIIRDPKSPAKYLFIVEKPNHLIVIEVRRKESRKTEVNTIYRIDSEEQKRLDKFPTA